jgi:hypothetical protein
MRLTLKRTMPLKTESRAFSKVLPYSKYSLFEILLILPGRFLVFRRLGLEDERA